jgi:quinol-cytochrome oxidoreductase complex cytochrome b subunit
MRRMVRDNGLSITMFALFLVFLVAQSIAGYETNNSDNQQHQQPKESYAQYLTSGAFAEATFENWESEFLQMGAYVLLTAFLIQKGSPESKDPGGDQVDTDPRTQRDDPDAPGPVKRGGLVLTLYEHSLSLALFGLFLLSLVFHALGGRAEFNQQQLEHGAAPVSLWSFVTSSEFWFQSMQNWQSEFLAVAVLAVLGIFLRQRGSPESKPVAAPHAQTGSS